MSPLPRRLAVVGAGWAGLAAAVRAVQAGWQVTLFDMARHAGGRARSVRLGRTGDRLELDNGQHILIGAYVRTLDLMRTVGVEPERVLDRAPLRLAYPDGRGLRLSAGPAIPALAMAIVRAEGWHLADKAALLVASLGWMARRFRCNPALTVAALCAGLPARVRRDLIDPLCVAALNTPAASASATVFLRVLRDALFAGPGASDLLLPRTGLSALLPDPAIAWLQSRGADLRWGRRAGSLSRQAGAWTVDGERVDAVVLACPAAEAARLASASAPAWADVAGRLSYQPIVTAYLCDPMLRLPSPMLALDDGPDAPAQFVFDLGALGRGAGLFAFVVSGAAPWLERGLEDTGQAVIGQARRAFGGHFPADDALVHLAAERRATFACTPGLARPPASIAPGLVAAGDYVAGPYPATLEGAVRAGEQAIALLETVRLA